MTEYSPIQLSIPYLKGNELTYVSECLTTGWISSVGRFVAEFEGAICSYTGASHAVAVVNGTAALHLALRIAGVRAGDLVVAPSLTFIASINPISYCGAIPLFLDVDPETMGLCPDSVETFFEEACECRKEGLVHIESGRKITAMLPVSLYGHSCKIQQLVDLAKRYKIKLVEDAAEAVGCFVDKRHSGTFGDIGCLSFNGNKLLTTGGGGMLLTDDDELAAQARHLSTQAKADPERYIHDEIGYNYRLTNVAAAIGLGQLEQLETMISRKRAIHDFYKRELEQIDGVSIFEEPQGCRSTYWLGLLKTESPGIKHAVIRACKGSEIQVRMLWEPIHLQAMYQEALKGRLSMTGELYDRYLCIPCHQGMSDLDATRVVDAIKTGVLHARN